MNKEKTNTLTIMTPEGVVFSMLLSGPVTRFLAWAVDLASIAVISSVIGSVLGIVGILGRDLAMAASILAYFVVSIGYGIILEWYWRGQTIGKRLLGLRVMDEQGLRLQFSQIVIRNLLRFVDSLPLFYFIGGLACLISRRAQRLGDVAANTVVVWTPKISEPDLDQLLSDKYNSFHDYPHIEARLRQIVSPHESGIALRALLRRDELDALARVELFRDIAAHFKSIVEFPQEATDGIPDEQYVRNVVDVLYRAQSQGL
ncbi:MAG: RDD family protein [Deltaproteobacteria bacterium]|nr:RDD family protein [Deltaproteobacteria bacterium]MBW2117629.1 RDD family protein [Deltaproteobacteria bacterium]MBW2343943.1 RDD family protein [Deltaproteobacteria bacterium]